LTSLEHLVYNEIMNRKLITQLAYEYLDLPPHPSWDGLFFELTNQGCTSSEAQQILFDIRKGDY